MAKKPNIIIAIDGPAGAGKSTVAKLVARKFSLLYVDSGAMYRAVAWKALAEKIDIANEKAVAELAEKMKIDLQPSGEETKVFVNGKEITGAIRTPEVTEASSRIATIRKVREILVDRQRIMGYTRGLVMEGRDIGTVVFPDTPLKFYLDASAEKRAARRQKDLERAGHRVKLEDLKHEVMERDKRDMSRDVSPLKRVDDAIYVDTSDLSIEEVVETISSHVQSFCEKVTKQ